MPNRSRSVGGPPANSIAEATARRRIHLLAGRRTGEFRAGPCPASRLSEKSCRPFLSRTLTKFRAGRGVRADPGVLVDRVCCRHVRCRPGPESDSWMSAPPLSCARLAAKRSRGRATPVTAIGEVAPNLFVAGRGTARGSRAGFSAQRLGGGAPHSSWRLMGEDARVVLIGLIRRTTPVKPPLTIRGPMDFQNLPNAPLLRRGSSTKDRQSDLHLISSGQVAIGQSTILSAPAWPWAMPGPQLRFTSLSTRRIRGALSRQSRRLHRMRCCWSECCRMPPRPQARERLIAAASPTGR